MNVKQMIKGLQKLKPELQEKDIFIISENGLRMPPEIKFIMNDYSKMDKSAENVECIVLT